MACLIAASSYRVAEIVINPVPGLDAEQGAEPFADRPVLEVVLDDLNG